MAQDVPTPTPTDPEADRLYPSARICAECHPNQFRQWSVSSHAYASMSPMFNKFEQKINDLASGTIKTFCLRCHASVGTSLGESRDIPLWERSQASREGITCITCHRVGEAYGKVNGARRIAPGDIHEPVIGAFDSEGVLQVIGNARKYKVLVSSDQPDRPGYLRIHQQAIQSDLMAKSEFCVACHQVAVYPGIKLETVWEEYRASPAAAEGITCQDCHMGTKPGRKSPTYGWAAIVNGLTVKEGERKLADHTFVGPGYPVSHPGLFPISKEPSPFTPQQWLTFDYRADWGSKDFEAKVAASPGSHSFPPEWQDPADRKKAWQGVQINLARWKEREALREDLLEHASHLDGPFFDNPPKAGRPFSFEYKLTNLNKGHNLPSGSLGAQPQVWLNVSLIDPDGERVWESGYIDSNGDLADLQSADVGAGSIEHDDQLFSLQSKFLTTNVKGTDREMYLPISLDADQLPFIRPGGVPVSILNHPPGVRLEKRSIPPMGSRVAKYKVPGDLMSKQGTYRLAVRLRSRSEPIYFMEFVGSTTDMKRAMNEWITDTHSYAVEIDVGTRTSRPSRAATTTAEVAPPAADAAAAAAEAAAKAAAEAAAAEAAARQAAAAEAAARQAEAEAAARQAAAEAAARQAAAAANRTQRVAAAAEPCLSVRAEPAPGASRLQCLAPGSVVEVLDEQDGWSRIQLRNGGYGWLASSLLEPATEGGGS